MRSNRETTTMEDRLMENLIREIFADAGLGAVGVVHKEGVGFSNHVYSIDGRYVFKTGKSEEDEEYLRRDAYLCSLLADRIPAPRIIKSGFSGKLVGKFYMIYQRIPGENLYSKWHLLNEVERRELTRQVCRILRLINDTPYEGFAREFHIDEERSWHDRICSSISDWLDKDAARGFMPPELVAATREFMEKNGGALRSQRIALTYWDPHFDNLIVSDDNRIAGILDYERTDVLSIDYVLDLVRRMALRPGKYASEYSERFARPEDYSCLMRWYEEFYPELFEFEDLGTRLDIYSVEHSLAEIFYYPEGTEARQELVQCIGR